MCIRDRYTTGNSSCSSLASNSINNSITWSTTFSGVAPGLSILFITTIGFNPNANDFFKTSLVDVYKRQTSNLSKSNDKSFTTILLSFFLLIIYSFSVFLEFVLTSTFLKLAL